MKRIALKNSLLNYNVLETMFMMDVLSNILFQTMV